ncbi:MAG: FUSC family protein [Devosia sp.]
MEQLTKVDRAQDPWFAVRTALGVGLAVVLAQPMGVTVTMLPAAFALALLSGQRGAFDLKRAVLPLIIPVLAWIISWLAAATLGQPLLFTALFITFVTLGLALMVFRGSLGGVIVILIPTMLSIAAVTSDQMLIAMRDSMAMSGAMLTVIIIVLNLIFPPRTTHLHVPLTEPHQTDNPLLDLALRTAIFTPVLLYCYATADTNLIIMPIMVAYVLGQSDHTMRRREAMARISATLIGAATAIGILLAYRLMPNWPLLVAAMTLVTLYFTAKMFDGARSAVTYQFACSVAAIIVMSSFANRDAIEVVIQRVVLSTTAALMAICLLALLETLFLAPPRQRLAGR